jgi:hypothetical protein
MRKTMRTISISMLVLCAVLLGCNQRTDRDAGSVILTVTAFDGLPIRVALNSMDLVQVEELTLANIPKDPNGITSDLQNIELQTYEVTFTRADTGSRTPPARVNGIFGNVPVNGEDTIMNLDVMGIDQLANPPLSDLLFQNGGFDTETGSAVIQLNVNLRFFGRTLSGDNISSNTVSWLIEFVQ